MRLSRRLARSPTIAIISFTVILIAIFSLVILGETYLLTHDTIIIEGGNYPVSANLSGAVVFSKGPGTYNVELTPAGGTSISYKVCCLIDGNLTSCKRLHGTGGCAMNCGSVAIVYNATVPPHQVKIAEVRVSKEWP